MLQLFFQWVFETPCKEENFLLCGHKLETHICAFIQESAVETAAVLTALTGICKDRASSLKMEEQDAQTLLIDLQKASMQMPPTGPAARSFAASLSAVIEQCNAYS